MSGCCDEYNCKRKTPLGINLGWLTGEVYVNTRMRLVADNGDGTGTFSASERHVVTRQMESFIRENREWVEGVLNNEVPAPPAPVSKEEL